MRRLLVGLVSLVLVACSVDSDVPTAVVLQESVVPPGLYIVGGHPGNAPNVRPEKHFSRLGMFTARMMPEQARGLRNNPNIRFVEPDGIVTLDQSMPWGLDRIDQRDLPLDGSYLPPGDGSGATVYVVDSGIDFDHPEFGGRARLGFDYYNGGGQDCHGHGTHVSGTIAGQTVGVATGATLVAVRVFPCEPSSPWSVLIEGLEWVANQSPGVVNMSLGGPSYAPADEAVQTLTDLGFVSIVSAGNDNYDACLQSPARVLGAVTVGAISQSDTRASFSNFGECVDLFAPGVSVESSLLGGGYTTMNGTSMAAPHVSGVAALLWASVPPAEIPDALWSFSSKNRVLAGQSENAHVLYAHPEHDPDLGDPPDWVVLPAPTNHAAEPFVREGQEFSAIKATYDWDGDRTKLRWFEGWVRYVHPDSTWRRVSNGIYTGSYWIAPYFYSDGTLPYPIFGGGDYEVKTRAISKGNWLGEWSDVSTVTICSPKNRKSIACGKVRKPRGRGK